jgi:hypothetical protein
MTQPHFYIFLIISPLKRTWPFIWTKLNSLHPKIICSKFNWFWPAGFFKKKKLSVFLLFCYYLPLERVNPLYLNKLGIIHPKDDLCQVWLKLAPWFWRFLNDPTPILHFCDYLPYEEELSIYLNKLELPSSKDNLYQVWLNLACWFWRRRFLKIFSVFFTLSLLSPLGEGLSPSLDNLKSPIPKDDSCQV